MGFVGPLGKLFRESFSTAGAAAAPVSWWLSGGIAAANCLAAYQPKGAASLAASYDNKAAPGNGLPDGTYDAAPGVAPTWAAATGWTFNGLTQYLRTFLTISANTTWSVFCQFSGVSGTNRNLFGILSALAGRLQIAPISNVGGATVFYGNGAFGTAAPTLATGNLGIAGSNGYRNGVFDVAIAAGAGGSLEMYMGCYNQSGIGAAAFITGNILALSVYNVQLTAPQIAALAAAMAAL